MKKIISLMLCLLFCVTAFVGCGGLGEDEKGPNIRMYLTDYPYTLDPAAVQLNSDVDQILSLIYEPLTRIDEEGNVVGALATDWYYEYDEIYNLHTMYFQIKDTKWSDNRAVSADDVVYAWSRILDPAMDSPYASLLYGIKGARDVKSGLGTIDDLGLAAVESTLLRVTFEDEYNYDLFAEQVANVHLAPCREDIVTRSAADTDASANINSNWAASATDIVCNGPFRVQAMDMPRPAKEGEDDYSSKSECKLVLERNAYFLREEDDELDEYVTPYRITCYYYEGQVDLFKDEGKNTQEAFQAYRYLDNDIYFLSSFEKATYAHLADEMETSQTLNGFAFYFNTQNELLKDADVRKALSAALDRNAIVSETTGTGEIAATGYVPNGVFNTDKNNDFREVGGNLYNTVSDMDTAKSLVKGKEKGTLKVTYLIQQNAYTIKRYNKKVNYANSYKQIAQKACEYWNKLGYETELVGLNPDEYLAALKNRDYDIIGVNITSGSVDALNYLAPFAKEYSGTGIVTDYSAVVDEKEIFNTHYTNIDDADYSALIDSAVNTIDRAERATILHQAEEKLVDLCPATMVFWYTANYVASDSIDGYDMNSWFGYMDFTELSLDDWREVNSKETEESLALID